MGLLTRRKPQRIPATLQTMLADGKLQGAYHRVPLRILQTGGSLLTLLGILVASTLDPISVWLPTVVCFATYGIALILLRLLRRPSTDPVLRTAYHHLPWIALPSAALVGLLVHATHQPSLLSLALTASLILTLHGLCHLCTNLVFTHWKQRYTMPASVHAQLLDSLQSWVQTTFPTHTTLHLQVESTIDPTTGAIPTWSFAAYDPHRQTYPLRSTPLPLSFFPPTQDWEPEDETGLLTQVFSPDNTKQSAHQHLRNLDILQQINLLA